MPNKDKIRRLHTNDKIVEMGSQFFQGLGGGGLRACMYVFGLAVLQRQPKVHIKLENNPI